MFLGCPSVRPYVRMSVTSFCAITHKRFDVSGPNHTGILTTRGVSADNVLMRFQTKMAAWQHIVLFSHNC